MGKPLTNLFVNDYYHHPKSGGLYRVITLAEIEETLEKVVVYKNTESGRVWVRPIDEFKDGRFEEASTLTLQHVKYL